MVTVGSLRIKFQKLITVMQEKTFGVFIVAVKHLDCQLNRGEEKHD